MSVEQLEATVLQLSPEERRRFVRWFYAHEDQILEPRPNDEIHPEAKAEILKRREDALARPETLEPWEGTTEHLRQQLHEIRRKKTAAR